MQKNYPKKFIIILWIVMAVAIGYWRTIRFYPDSVDFQIIWTYYRGRLFSEIFISLLILGIVVYFLFFRKKKSPPQEPLINKEESNEKTTNQEN